MLTANPVHGDYSEGDVATRTYLSIRHVKSPREQSLSRAERIETLASGGSFAGER